MVDPRDLLYNDPANAGSKTDNDIKPNGQAGEQADDQTITTSSSIKDSAHQYDNQIYDQIMNGTQSNNAYNSGKTYNEEGELVKSEETPEQGLSNTGSGAEAALGTQYSWNQNASDAANKQYQADLETQKQQYLSNRQTIENNAANYQVQADMAKYSNNQNAEKVGWTGGYILDQNRQMEYLKASIQAQMYGAMELQKYGLDSALAAARLSYDLNQQEYALKYYQEAQQTAINEAQLTGIYFSAEVKDMLNQLAVAKQKASDSSTTTAEKENANKLTQQIYSWFRENGISPEGVKTTEQMASELAAEREWSKELWTRYQAASSKIEEQMKTNSSLFIKVDDNGNPIFDGLSVQTIDLSHVNAGEAMEYVVAGGKINASAQDQLYSYFDSIFEQCIANYKQSVTSTSNGESYVRMTEEGLKQAIQTALDKIAQYGKVKNTSEDAEKFNSLYKEVIDNYEYVITETAVDSTSGSIKLDGTGVDGITVAPEGQTKSDKALDKGSTITMNYGLAGMDGVSLEGVQVEFPKGTGFNYNFVAHYNGTNYPLEMNRLVDKVFGAGKFDTSQYKNYSNGSLIVATIDGRTALVVKINDNEYRVVGGQANDNYRGYDALVLSLGYAPERTGSSHQGTDQYHPLVKVTDLDQLDESDIGKHELPSTPTNGQYVMLNRTTNTYAVYWNGTWYKTKV